MSLTASLLFFLKFFSAFLIVLSKLASILCFPVSRIFLLSSLVFSFSSFVYANKKKKKSPLLLCPCSVGVEGSESVQFTTSKERSFPFSLKPWQSGFCCSRSPELALSKDTNDSLIDRDKGL